MTDPDSILQLGIEAAKEGNNRDARELFRLLVKEDPRNARGWLWLAGVAETNDERINALQQVYALEPDNQLARDGLRALGVDVGSDPKPAPVPAAPPPPIKAAPPPPPAAADMDFDDPFAELDSLSDAFGQDPGAVRREDSVATSNLTPLDDTEAAEVRAAASSRPRTLSSGSTKKDSSSSRKTGDLSSSSKKDSARSSTASSSRKATMPDKTNNDIRKHKYYPLLLFLTALVVLCGAFAVFDGAGRIRALFGGGQQTAQQPSQPEQPVDPNASQPEQPVDPNAPQPEQPVDPNAPQLEQPPLPPNDQPAPPDQPAPIPPVGDPATANPSLNNPNTILESNGWFYNFPTATYAVRLPSPLGGLDARGQFALVLTFVSNGTGQAQPVPADFFVLRDAQGRVYFPSPEASAAYRASGGVADISLGDVIPADGVTRSLPLVFDTAPDASGLLFFAPSNPDQGWLVLP
ncbi:MAG: hypothetical protein HC911_09255 [Chloroflexaceae bacterium]|nr:hypothetical protein [Chloroflexaceae bacterium]